MKTLKDTWVNTGIDYIRQFNDDLDCIRYGSRAYGIFVWSHWWVCDTNAFENMLKCDSIHEITEEELFLEQL